MHIREIDPADEALTHRFWEIGKAAAEENRPWAQYWSWPGAREDFVSTSVSQRRLLLCGFAGGAMLGGAEIVMPRLDNLHVAWLNVYVDPVHQRRGAGSALVEAAVQEVARRGRSHVLVEVPTPLGAEKSPALRLARRSGFETGVVNDMKVADLDETQHLWGELLADTVDAAEGYSLRSWRNVCPDDLVEGYCALMESFLVESPTGELELEAERWDEQRLRDKESRFRRAGRQEFTTVAVAPDGEVVGMTEAMVSEHAPDRGFQGGTIVASAHRGRRIGLRLKATNHRLLKHALPSCRTLLTGNADVNVAMNALNDLLGYRAVEQVIEMQRLVDPRR